MKTETVKMYEFSLQCWDGVRRECPADHEVYRFLDAASERAGYGSRAPDASDNQAMMRIIVSHIRPDKDGLKPRVAVVPAKSQ